YGMGLLGEVRSGINVPLWRNGPVDRRRTAIARAELQTRAARAGTDLQLIDSVRQATQRYWDWVAAGQRLRVAEELLRIARERQEGIEERARAGDIPEIEGADNARTIRQREARVVAAERTLQAAAIELSLYLRDPDGTPRVPDASRLPDAFPAPMPSSELERLAEHTELAFARRPELVRLQAQRGQQELEREWAANQAAPAVDLSIAASRDLGEVPPKLQKTDLELGLLIELPLQRRTAIGRREAAEATIAGLQAQLRLTMDRIQNEVRDAAIGLDAARRRVELAAAEITLAERLAEGERTRLSLGDSNVLLVNLREQALAEARLGLVEALQEYFRTRAQFGYATGAWLPAGDSPQG
ncbi:MAG: TolC family protein, partial [Myxococcales bacterium]